jgi:ankyrin repeat protein
MVSSIPQFGRAHIPTFQGNQQSTVQRPGQGETPDVFAREENTQKAPTGIFSRIKRYYDGKKRQTYFKKLSLLAVVGSSKRDTKQARQAIDKFRKAGGDLNQAEFVSGRTLLHVAAAQPDNGEFVQILLEAGAKVDSANKFGNTPLHEASSYGYGNTVQILLEAGADVDQEDNFGRTPLHDASRYGRDNIVNILLAAEAKVDQANEGGNTPLHEASRSSYDNTVQILLDKGAKVDQADKGGYTPLHDAALFRQDDIVQILLAHGADPTVKSHSGKTPRALAKDSDYQPVSENYLRTVNRTAAILLQAEEDFKKPDAIE